VTQAAQFEFDQYESQYATAGVNKKQQSIFDGFGEEEKPAYSKGQAQSKKNGEKYRGDNEDIGYADFGNFNGFSGFVGSPLR
jgi:hypothetical protein